MKRRIILSILAAILMMLLSAGAQAATYPESEHPYDTNTDKTWTYKHSKSAYALKVTFSEETAVEWDCDFIYITDSLGREVTYTGSVLSNQTIVLPGNRFSIRLVTDEYDDDLYYGFEITGITAMTQADCENSVKFTISSDGVITGYSGFINDLVIPNAVNGIKVTGIGDSVFDNCLSLTSVVVPEGVKSIGYRAFAGCRSLASITLPDSLTSIGSDAFYGCDSLTGVTLPQNLTSIDHGAFGDCDKLTSIVIPDSVTFMGMGVFYNCDSLTTVTLPKYLTCINDDTFWSCDKLSSVTMPEKLKEIYPYAFSGCDCLTSIELPESLTYIGDSAFIFTGLTSIVIPEGVTSIGSNAFAGCENLASVTLPESLAIIESYGFYYCEQLTSITIPANVTEIGDYAFAYAGLKEVTFPGKTMPKMGKLVFEECKPTVYCYFGSAAEMWAIEQGYEVEYLPLDTMVLPEDLTAIEDGAFMGVDAGEVIIPNGCKSIGSRAFADCKGLWMVTVPESVDFIADNAFEGCVSVTFTGVYGSCAEEFANAHGFDFVGE